MDFQIVGANRGEEITVELKKEENGILFAEIRMIQPEETVPASFRINFKFPAVDCYSVWSANLRQARQLGPNWAKRTTGSRLASGMPLHSLISPTGRNRMTVALSDAKTPLSIGTGICEEDLNLDCAIT